MPALAEGQRVEVVDVADEKEGTRPPQITVVLTPEIVDRLRGAAARKGVKPSVLLRIWALEKLDEEDQRIRERGHGQ